MHRLIFGCALVSLVIACDDTGGAPPGPGRGSTSTATTPKADAAPLAASGDAASTPAAPSKKKPSDCKVPDTIEFTDPVMEKAVKYALSVGHDGGLPDKVTKADLAQVRTLNLFRYGSSKELDPCLIPLMTNVRELQVKGDVDDLSPLESLQNLETLRVSPAKITDLGPLRNLARLSRIDVSHTLVGDISPLSMLVNLKELILDGDTSVSDLSPLAGASKLEDLKLRNTAVTNLGSLSGLRALRTLDITGTPVSDLSPVAGQRSLKIVR